MMAHTASSPATLVVIIPALNEARTVGQVITRIPRRLAGVGKIDVVVIDDGSTDTTAAVAQASGAHVVHHPYTMGVGAAFQTGLSHALWRGADIIVNIDADGQFNPADIPTLIAPILNQQAWFTTATRFKDPRLTPRMPLLKRWGNGWIVWLVNRITGNKFTDVSCGFRAYSRETILRLVLFGHFTYTQETFIDLAFKGIPIVEVPLPVRGQRPHGRSRMADNLWRYGLKSASIIFRAARDYRPLIFFGLPGMVVGLAGVLVALFLFGHWWQTGQTYPYRSLVPVAGVLLIVGILLWSIAMLADMTHRNRILLDKMVYLIRRRAYDTGEDRTFEL